jgi:hypothetical protein
MAKHIQNLTFHVYDDNGAVLFFYRAPSNELCAFMMQIVDGRFARHIMNEGRRLGSHHRG